MSNPQTIGESPAEPENIAPGETVLEVLPDQQNDHQRAEEASTEDTPPSDQFSSFQPGTAEPAASEPQPASTPDSGAAGTAPAIVAVEATPTGMEPVTPAPSEPHNDGRPKKAVRSAKKKHATKSVGNMGKRNTAKKPAAAAGSPITVPKKTTNVVVSKPLFNHTIIIPPAIDALFGMTPEERIAEVKRVCERDEVEALNNFVAPLTHWMNDLDYVLFNYSDVVDALEEHFNKPGRPQATRATWGDLNFDAETLKYLEVKFGYKPEMPISWAGICNVFFNRSIRTMQRRKAYKAMLTSGETVVPPKATNQGDRSGQKKPQQSTSDQSSFCIEDQDRLRTAGNAARRYFEAQEAGDGCKADEAKKEFLAIGKMDSINSILSGDQPNYKRLLIDLLSDVEKIVDRLPDSLKRTCHEIRKRLGIGDTSLGLTPADRSTPSLVPPSPPVSTAAATDSQVDATETVPDSATGNPESTATPEYVNGLQIVKRRDGKWVVLDPAKKENNTVAICDDMEKAVAAAKKKKPEQVQSAQTNSAA